MFLVGKVIDLTVSVHILRQVIKAEMQTALDKGVGRLEFEFLITCFSFPGLSLPPCHPLSSCKKGPALTKLSDDFMILPIIAADVPKSCFITKPPPLPEPKKKKGNGPSLRTQELKEQGVPSNQWGSGQTSVP